MMLFLKCIY